MAHFGIEVEKDLKGDYWVSHREGCRVYAGCSSINNVMGWLEIYRASENSRDIFTPEPVLTGLSPEETERIDRFRKDVLAFSIDSKIE